MSFGQSSYLTMSELGPCPGCNDSSQGSFLTMPEVSKYTPASAITSSPQMFGGMGSLGQAAQGTWLSPSQVAPSQRGSASRMAAHPQSFSLAGLGQGQVFGIGVGKLALFGGLGYLAYKLFAPK